MVYVLTQCACVCECESVCVNVAFFLRSLASSACGPFVINYGLIAVELKYIAIKDDAKTV